MIENVAVFFDGSSSARSNASRVCTGSPWENDHALERKVEHGAQTREGAVLVMGRHPDPEHSSSLGQRIAED